MVNSRSVNTFFIITYIPNVSPEGGTASGGWELSLSGSKHSNFCHNIQQQTSFSPQHMTPMITRRTEALAKENGCTHTYAIVSSKYSSPIFDRLGHTMVISLNQIFSGILTISLCSLSQIFHNIFSYPHISGCPFHMVYRFPKSESWMLL